MTPEIQLASQLVKHFEGCHLERYICPAGVPTIGWGETRPDRVAMGRILQAQADAWLVEDLEYFFHEIQKRVTAKLSTAQWAAIISFAYNVGVTAFYDSTLLKMINDGNISAASLQFERWVYGKNHKQLAGLVARRKSERFIFDGGSIRDLSLVHRWFQS